MVQREVAAIAFEPDRRHFARPFGGFMTADINGFVEIERVAAGKSQARNFDVLLPDDIAGPSPRFGSRARQIGAPAAPDSLTSSIPRYETPPLETWV